MTGHHNHSITELDMTKINSGDGDWVEVQLLRGFSCTVIENVIVSDSPPARQSTLSLPSRSSFLSMDPTLSTCRDRGPSTGNGEAIGQSEQAFRHSAPRPTPFPQEPAPSSSLPPDKAIWKRCSVRSILDVRSTQGQGEHGIESHQTLRGWFLQDDEEKSMNNAERARMEKLEVILGVKRQNCRY